MPRTKKNVHVTKDLRLYEGASVPVAEHDTWIKEIMTYPDDEAIAVTHSGSTMIVRIPNGDGSYSIYDTKILRHLDFEIRD
jgi:hypothetical protein